MNPEPRIRHYLGLSSSGFHRLAYREWGAKEAGRTLVCVHGLTRNAQDFDDLAAAAAERGWRVVCPDVVGRGASDALADPTGYSFPQYLQDMTALLARLDVEKVYWVGTSMGGLIGMLLAAQPRNPLNSLVMNDIGPFLPQAALEQIADHAGQEQVWSDFASAAADLRQIHAGFGPLDDEQWRLLAERSVVQGEDGLWRRRYDPALGRAFAEGPQTDVDLWALWDRLSLPVLVLRGGLSELLTAETAAEMAQRGPRAEVVDVPESGHAPALMRPSQIALILDWLEQSR